jgi:hypothetical protein
MKVIVGSSSDKDIVFHRVGDLVNKIANNTPDNILPFEEVKYDKHMNLKLTNFFGKGGVAVDTFKMPKVLPKTDIKVSWLERALKEDEKKVDEKELRDDTTRVSSAFTDLKVKKPGKRKRSLSPVNNKTLSSFIHVKPKNK